MITVIENVDGSFMRGYTVKNNVRVLNSCIGRTSPLQRLITQTFLIVMVIFWSKLSYADTITITWNTGSEVKIRMNPIADDTSATIVFSGVTSQKMLIVKVAKIGGLMRSNPIPLSPDGSFNVRYLLKDGVGKYAITFFGSEQRDSRSYQGLGNLTKTVNTPLPPNLAGLELNSKVIEFITKAMGTTVGRGECWDVAQKALDMTLADWNRPTSFGQPVNPDTTEVKAGDIIQFNKLTTVEHLSSGVIREGTLGSPDHTAIIYKVLGKKWYTLAHQNVRGKRSVITGDINLANMTGGKYWIYRPVALMIQQ